MFTIAGCVLDVYDDINKDILKENLEKIGSFKLDPPDEIEKLSYSDFAAVFMTKTGRAIRRYPIHSPDSTALSALYFEKVAESLPETAKATIAFLIKKAHDVHSLPLPPAIEEAARQAQPDCSNILKIAELDLAVKEMSSTCFALDDKYPIDTPEQIKQASEYFEENHMYFCPEDRAKYASSVLGRTHELKFRVSSSSALHKYAGTEYGNLVQSAYHERANLLHSDEMALRALGHLFEKRSSLKPNEFADELCRFDQTNYLDRHWDKSLGVRDPYKSTYENVKIAKVVKVGSDSISEDTLHNLADSGHLKSAFDDEFCQQFSESPVEIFQSLPKPEQETIIQMAGEL